MIRQCCACKKILEGERWVTPRQEQLEQVDITHSYCEECRREFMRSVAEYFAAGRSQLALVTGA